MSRMRVAFASLPVALLLWIASAAAQSAPVEGGPRQVQLLIYLIDLVEISASDQSFFADVIIEASWNDPTLAGRAPRTYDLDDIWNPELLIVNQRSVSRSLPEVIRVDADGHAVYQQRFTGRFSAPMDLRDFPMDSQQLEVQVIAAPGPATAIELVPFDAATLRAERLSITDWSIRDVRVQRADYRATPRARVLPGLALQIDASRMVKYYIVQILIPLIAIVLMSWTVFWIDPAVMTTRMSVAVTTMLTLIAYRFMLGTLVPRLSYLTRLDYFMFGATTLVIVTLFTMAGTSYLTSRGKTAAVARIDRAGRVLFPTLLLLYAALIWLP